MLQRSLAIAGLSMVLAAVPGCRSNKDQNKESQRNLEALPYLNWVPVDKKDQAADGVVINEKDVFAGYNLYNSRPRSEALLMDMDGSEVHRWKGDAAGGWHHIEMMPDGSLIVLVKDESIAKLDWRSNVQWTRPIRAHHDVALAPDGKIYVLARSERVLTGSSGPELRFLDDHVEILGPDGETLKKISIYDLFGSQVRAEAMDALRKANADPAARLTPGGPFDLFHTNSIEILDRDVPGLGTAGNVLLSMRQLHTIAVVDLDKGKATWQWGPGELQHQHQPTITKNGHVLVFDNGTERGYSRVLEIDPTGNNEIGNDPTGDDDNQTGNDHANGDKTGNHRAVIVWQYSQGPDGDFYSRSRGGNQQLPNGNVLITESNDGRAFEVTRDGRVVWDFYNPDRKDDRRAAIYRMVRLSKEAVAPLLAPAGEEL